MELLTSKQQKENRQYLVDALRSGKYTQTKLNLRNDEGFCILGVACDVFSNKTQRGFWERNCNYAFYEFNLEEHYYNCHLPNDVRYWYGFKTKGGFIHENKYPGNSLMDLNDLYAYSFSQLANIIEREPELIMRA